ncbi:RHS repeat domain-containing protein [Undibacterium sp. Ji42W]|uniref:RHS repeat domain-containing protein n=1 Tax=Undibacterium sp. Ji42W TaxID=3413039 RepID=UPI003BF00965
MLFTGNRLTQLADSITGNIGFNYDNLDRITQVTSPNGIVNYTYDANGQRSSMTVAGQPTQNYTYDKVGRLIRIDQAAGAINNNQAQAIQFIYDDAGRLTKTTYANGITRDNSYDDAGQLTGITYKKADNSLIGDLTYTYDANGRRTKTSGSLAKTDLPDTTSTTSYDANNRLATWGSQILNYDANGNLTSDGLKTYIWNARNQLIQIKDSTGTEVASFSYDALGRRQAKTINGVSTGFMYDGVNIVQELNGTNVTNSYISAGVDQVFVQQSGTGPSASSLTYLTDALGSTIRLTNATGDKVVDYSYDPYGNTKADAVINNSFQYTGRENDGTGLYYYRARYYSPATHRFISEDPIGLNGGINTYGYVGGNPISFTDPSGRCFGPLIVACYYGVLYAEQLLIGAEIVAAISTGAMMPSASPAATAAKSTARAVTTIAEEIGTVQVFNSFKQAKTALGTQPGENIHHVVEQCQAARSGFPTSALNTTSNLVRLPEAVHDSISAHYSTLVRGTNMTLRDSLNGLPYQKQYEIGLDIVQKALAGKL